MPYISIRDILNRLSWDKRLKPEDYAITFIHRGAEGDRKTIAYNSIVKIGKSWFTFKSGEDESFIPYHRIVEIRNLKTGEALWKRMGI